MPILTSYPESNYSADLSIYAGFVVGKSQSFTGDGGTLDTAKFYLEKIGSPTGNAVAKIYAHTGTYGTSSKPTGVALATSDVFDVSTLTTSYQLITFTFSDANKITLENGTYYVVTFEFTGGTGSNYLNIGYDNSSPTAGGNSADNVVGQGWTAQSGFDAIFYVYRDAISSFSPSISPSISPSFSSSLSASVSSSLSPSISPSGSVSQSISPSISSSFSSSRSPSKSPSFSPSISQSISSSISFSFSSSISPSTSFSPSGSYSSSLSPSASSSFSSSASFSFSSSISPSFSASQSISPSPSPPNPLVPRRIRLRVLRDIKPRLVSAKKGRIL